MYPFLQGLIADREVKSAFAERNEIGFDAEAVVGALVFHLIDQGHVKSVDPESIEAAKRVLSNKLSRRQSPLTNGRRRTIPRDFNGCGNRARLP